MNALSFLLLFGIACSSVLSSCSYKKKPRKIYRQIDHDRPKKLIKEMKFEEAVAAVHYYQKENKLNLEIKALERAITLGNNHEQLRDLRLRLADAYYTYGNLEKARTLYKEYLTLYPRSQKRDQVLYKTIKASYKSTLTSDRDQALTHETIDLINDFLKRPGISPKYSAKATELAQQCYAKLCQYDLHVGKTYIDLYKYNAHTPLLTAAENRLKHLKQEYLPYIHTTPHEIIAFEQELTKLKAPSLDSSDSSGTKHYAQRF